jgi:NDP-sugar pyrophosphorylase family protein
MRNPTLKAGVIAAGRGDRLRKESNTLKPLARVAGRPLIEWILKSLSDAGVSEVVIIINEDSVAVRDRVDDTTWPFKLRWIVETTPSSMHSFLRVLETLAAGGDEGPFLISTVDTIAAAQTFKQFVAQASANDSEISLAVTPKRNDEKPLLVDWSGDRHVTALGEQAAGSKYATAGLYFVRSSVLAEVEAARKDNLGALRKFLGRLLKRGYRMAAIPVGESIDVDRAADVLAAEKFLREVSA